VYLELRIHELLWGEERASMLHAWGYKELCAEIDRMGASSPDTRLCYDMTGRDPAEGVTVIPYLKGASFFWTIETLVGRPRLDAWLRGWFERRAFQSVTTETLLADLRAHLFAGDDAALGAIDLEAWVSEPGVPRAAPPRPSALLERADAAAHALAAGADPRSIDSSGFTPQAWRHLLGALLATPPSAARLAALDEAFGLSASTNSEVLLPWLRLLARGDLAGAEERIERFLSAQGRFRYLRPLYADLLGSPAGAPLARRAYADARPRYHALVRAGLDKLFAASSQG